MAVRVVPTEEVVDRAVVGQVVRVAQDKAARHREAEAVVVPVVRDKVALKAMADRVASVAECNSVPDKVSRWVR